MIKEFTFEDFANFAETKKRVAVYKEVSADIITPVQAYYHVKDCYKGVSLLESCGNVSNGRYSYLCLDAYDEFSLNDSSDKEAFIKLQKYLDGANCYYDNKLCKYTGAAIGYMGYDSIRFIEDIPNSNKSLNNIPLAYFKLHRVCIAFDHQEEKVVVSVAVDITTNPCEDYDNAMSEIDNLIETLFKPQNISHLSVNKVTESEPVITDTTDDEYAEMVIKAKDYIVNGDAFQIVLSRTFSKKCTAAPFDVYRALRLTNPSPYMFYIEGNDFDIVGASPEVLVSVKNGIVETNPIAGTRPRGEDKVSDNRIEDELLADEKELAEHMMLVDLARNDLGKVCEPFSIKPKKLKGIQKLAKVMHITSEVEGILSPNKNLIDAIKAVFPAGTLSGAPKIRAMEIIDELEQTQRGIYGGAVCIIDSEKNLDACIAIRMAVIKNEKAYVRAGAGIVYDSNPISEANETRQKASAVLDAISLAEGRVK